MASGQMPVKQSSNRHGTAEQGNLHGEPRTPVMKNAEEDLAFKGSFIKMSEDRRRSRSKADRDAHL